MSNSSTIVQLIRGKVPPKDHIEAIKRVYPTVFGFAVQHEGKLVYEQDEATWKLSIDEIMEMITRCKDEHRILFFGNFPNMEDHTDVQPWALTTSEGAPMVAMFFEGGFGKYGGLNGKHTNEYNALTEVIGGKLQEILDDDITKVIANLKDDTFRKKIKLFYDGRAWFSFLPSKGDPISFGDNDLAKGFDWGTISNGTNIIIQEAKKEEPAPAKKSGGPLDFLSAKASTPAVTPPSPSVAPAIPPPPIPGPEKVGDDMVKDMQTGIVYQRMEPPKKLDSSAKNLWLRLFNGKDAGAFQDDVNQGKLPDGHLKNDVWVPVHPSLVEFAKVDCKNSRDVKALVEEIKKAKASGKLKDFPAATAAESNENLSHSPDINTERANDRGSTVRESAFAMTVKDMEQTMDVMAEYLGGKSEKRLSPEDLKAVDSKKETFSQKCGFKFEDMIFVSDATLFKLFSGNKVAVEAYRELMTKYIAASGIKLEDLANTMSKAKEPEPEKKEAPKASGGPLDFLSAKKVA